jgi:polyhydroxyalkanoate synthesis repressor PhaR
MLLIKRYPNRKLYDTEAKQYVSLDDLARMIRQGTEIQVVDHATGDDLTTLTLVQVIAEQEKQRGGFLPLPLLQGLVQAGSATLAGLWRDLLSPLDLLDQVDAEIERRVLRLVALGELSDTEGRRLTALLLAVGATAADALVQARVARAIEARALASRAEVAHLTGLIEQLTAEIEALSN